MTHQTRATDNTSYYLSDDPSIEGRGTDGRCKREERSSTPREAKSLTGRNDILQVLDRTSDFCARTHVDSEGDP